jgi:hypothetical protein
MNPSFVEVNIVKTLKVETTRVENESFVPGAATAKTSVR